MTSQASSFGTDPFYFAPMNMSCDSVDVRAAQLFRAHSDAIHRKTDSLFVALMIVQWLGGVLATLIISPYTWTAAQRSPHIHVFMALFLGGVLASLPVYLGIKHPGEPLTRNVIAISQMLFSELLIAITGGRIETHFHIFASLAVLAFYRDWRVLVTATLVAILYHWLGAIYFPLATYGVNHAGTWRWVEHAFWVAMTDVFLFYSCRQGIQEMQSIALRQSQLEATNEVAADTANRLRESEAHTRQIIQTTLDAVVSIDAAGRVTEWNAQAELVFGYKVEDAIGRELARLIFPERFREFHRAGIERFLETGEGSVLNKRIEVPALHRDGSEFPLELAISPLKERDGYTFSAFMRDISDLKAAEQQRAKYTEDMEAARLRAEKSAFLLQMQATELVQARDQALASTRAKSEFLANMSHEVRTPMNGVLGMTGLLLDTELDAEQSDYARTIQSSANGLLVILNDILDFSKIEAGKLTLEREAFDLSAVMSEVVGLFSAQASQKGLTLSCFIPKTLPTLLIGDPVRLRQILSNLVGNSVKFTDSGKVGLSVDPVHDTPTYLRLRLRVRDTGIGIAPERQESIFDSFTQADGSTTRKYGGTGLGLTICRQLAELMDGAISVESRLGEGSVFNVELTLPKAMPSDALLHSSTPQERTAITAPLASEEALGGETPLASGNHSRAVDDHARSEGVPIRILLAEDNLVNKKVAVRLLERHALSIDVVSTGREALQQIASHPSNYFGAVLMDVQMPDMDGLEATSEVRAREAAGLAPFTGRSYIIAMTAHAMAGDRERCLAAGMDDYVTKPILKEVLLDALRRAVKASALESKRAGDDGEEVSFDTYVAIAPNQPQLETTPANVLPLDPVQFNEATGGDAGFQQELAAVFIQSAKDYLELIADATAEQDAAALYKAAHALKGSCRTLGAAALAEIARQIEQAAAPGELRSAEINLLELKAARELETLNNLLGDSKQLKAA